MSADEVFAQLRIVYRATNDFRFPDMKIDDGDEIVITAPAAEWPAFEVRDEVQASTRGAALISQVSLTYVETDAGADYNSLQFLAELGTGTLENLSAAGITGVVVYLGRLIKRSNDERHSAAIIREMTDADYEQHAMRAVAQKYSVPYREIRVERVTSESNGAGSVSMVVPDGRRFAVDIECKADGLIVHRMTRINPDV